MALIAKLNTAVNSERLQKTCLTLLVSSALKAFRLNGVRQIPEARRHDFPVFFVA
jgi:hypothetical protein